MSVLVNTYTQDVNENLDYRIDWSATLGDDTITGTPVWTVSPTGPTITNPAQSNTTTTTTCWFSGGTAGTDYQLEATVTTTGGRTFQGHIVILVRG